MTTMRASLHMKYAMAIDENKYTDSYTIVYSSDSTMQLYLKEKHVSSALALGTPNHFHKSTPLALSLALSRVKSFEAYLGAVGVIWSQSG